MDLSSSRNISAEPSNHFEPNKVTFVPGESVGQADFSWLCKLRFAITSSTTDLSHWISAKHSLDRLSSHQRCLRRRAVTLLSTRAQPEQRIDLNGSHNMYSVLLLLSLPFPLERRTCWRKQYVRPYLLSCRGFRKSKIVFWRTTFSCLAKVNLPCRVPTSANLFRSCGFPTSITAGNSVLPLLPYSRTQLRLILKHVYLHNLYIRYNMM